MSKETFRDALLEIGCEELPASFIPLGMKQLKAIAEASLREHRLAFGALSVFGTPRRLAIILTDVPPHSEATRQVMTGPPVAIARDAQGQWTAAALGFARKQSVKPTQLVVENDRLCAIKETSGLPTRSLLAVLFPQWMAALEFPKSMVWEPTHFRFPRPVRWLAGLYGPDPISFKVAGVKSGRWTYGLSLQSSKKIPLTNAAKYVMTLKNQCVLAEPAARLDAIRRLAEQAVRRVHGRVMMNDALLQQVADLVEHPAAILGNFDPAYLDLPVNVLITCLEHHQKFFPVESAEEPGRLLPNFIGIRNGVSVHQELVREGYERVLAARLADARFFFNQDRKSPLAKKVEALRGVTFQETLGSLFDKKERMQALLQALASLFPDSPVWLSGARRAAELCKADLVTDMVREFPELQGIMARLYAESDGEDPGVSRALQEHYWPVTLSGPLPDSEIASAVALTDKLDTLAGDFAVGLIPTGSADPYGLRRAAAGVLRILEARRWPLALEDLVARAFDLLPPQATLSRDKAQSELVRFFKQRYAALLEERGFRFDEVEAVLSLGLGRIHETLARLEALHEVRSRAEFGPLSLVFKRAVNIVRQAKQKEPSFDGQAVQTDLLKETCEQDLFQTFQGVHHHVNEQVREGAYRSALESMVPLREPLDHFFEGVMVMADDPALRTNRLALLTRIVELFLRVADFSKLQNA